MQEQRRPLPGEAAAYERYEVPRGTPFTQALLALAPPGPGACVLDVACGTGVVARAAAPFLRPHGRVVAVDRSPAMIAATRLRAAEDAAARRHAGEAVAHSIQTAVMDAQALALPDAAFDVAYCQFGLMPSPAPPRAAAELARVVRPGGAVAAVVWSVPANLVGFAAYLTAIQAHVPGALPAEQHPVFR